MDIQVDNPAAALGHPVAERPVDDALRTRLAWQALCSVEAPVAIVDVCSPYQPLVFVNRATGRMTVELACGLGLRCVAEGIGTAEQLNFFAALNCDEGQGYFFARPLEVEALDQWVAAKHRHPGAPATIGGCSAATFGAPIAPPAPDKALLPCMQ